MKKRQRTHTSPAHFGGAVNHCQVKIPGWVWQWWSTGISARGRTTGRPLWHVSDPSVGHMRRSMSLPEALSTTCPQQLILWENSHPPFLHPTIKSSSRSSYFSILPSLLYHFHFYRSKQSAYNCKVSLVTLSESEIQEEEKRKERKCVVKWTSELILLKTIAL